MASFLSRPISPNIGAPMDGGVHDAVVYLMKRSRRASTVACDVIRVGAVLPIYAQSLDETDENSGRT